MDKVATRDLLNTLKQKAEEIEIYIDGLMPKESAYPEKIHKAMRYSLFAGGKRLRAILAIESAHVVGGKRESAFPLAAAIEMIHAYSLIHDDLPCMDDDDLRRGKPSNHKVFGEGVAVLSGDALLTEAFIVLSKLNSLAGMSSADTVDIIGKIASACSSRGLIGGQVIDLESEGKKLNEKLLIYIHENKTGALFNAAIQCGGIVGGGNMEQLRSLGKYSYHFGLAFQITDDLLDVLSDTKSMGKPSGSDEAQDKLTFPRVYGIKKSKKLAEENVEKSVQALAIFGEEALLLRRLAHFILDRNA